MKRGDVVVALFPNTTDRRLKARPALVVQADEARTELNQLVLAQITSRMFRAGLPCRVTVLRDSPEGAQSGLREDSVIMLDFLATLPEGAIGAVIGSLPTDAVDAALRWTLGL